MKNVIKLSEQELRTNNKTSWHDQYRNSAWIFVGGLPYDLSEGKFSLIVAEHCRTTIYWWTSVARLGDIICVFSQYGEIVNINLIRDKKTGKQKGFCFLCYEDQRSTVLAVDNLNGIKVSPEMPEIIDAFWAASCCCRSSESNFSDSTNWKLNWIHSFIISAHTFAVFCIFPL